MEQKVFNGNNIDLLKQYPDNYFDAIVTDPPYGLGKEPDATELMKDWIEKGYHEVKGGGFMGKEWDAFVPQPIFWKEVFRVLKHGGHVLAFYGTRTYDWGVMAMRFAGFEVRDCIQWLYGSGFPKSHNISKAIDKMYGAEREVVGKRIVPDQRGGGINSQRTAEIGVPTHEINVTTPSTDQAKQWDGWGSALKPAHEDLVLARKPFQFSSDFVYLYENIVYNLKLQICQSKLFAKDVREIFLLSQKESKEVELDFAQWSVGKPFNTKEDLLVLMDMLQLEMKEGNTTLNIVLLWLNTLVELWNVANTYTTETESSTITELRILNSLEWESIFQNITLLKDNKTNGLIANVLTAESLFSVLNLKLNDILTHSAKENVTLKESEKNFVPNSEPIVLARKPLEKGLSIAENVLKWGVGGINIDGCRIGYSKDDHVMKYEGYQNGGYKSEYESGTSYKHGNQVQINPSGRFPANLILTHHPECEFKGMKKVKAIKGGNGGSDSMNKQGYGFKKIENGGNAGGLGDENDEETIEDWNCHPDCPIKILDEQSGESKSQRSQRGNVEIFKKENSWIGNSTERGHNDKGGASRFFYVAKASKSERNKGLEGFEQKETKYGSGGGAMPSGNNNDKKTFSANIHPTVKPIKLMQYLIRMITAPNGIVLDPFCGSGTTGVACKLEGVNFVGMEMDAEYCKIAEARINNYVEEKQEIKKSDEKNNSTCTQTSLF